MEDNNVALGQKLISKLLDEASDLNAAWNWGEECIRVDNVIKLIRDETGIKVHPKCFICNNYYAFYDKKDHCNHCIGKEHCCENFVSHFGTDTNDKQ